MSEITLDALKAQANDLIARIAAYEADRPRVLNVAGIAIELSAGEHYAGAALNEDGSVKHHLVLLAAKPSADLDWDDAKAWAAAVRGSLPDRQEAALIYANCKAHVDAEWHWTSERHETNASCAWYCYFGQRRPELQLQ